MLPQVARGPGRGIVVAAVLAGAGLAVGQYSPRKGRLRCQCAQRRSLGVEPEDKAKENVKRKAKNEGGRERRRRWGGEERGEPEWVVK